MQYLKLCKLYKICLKAQVVNTLFYEKGNMKENEHVFIILHYTLSRKCLGHNFQEIRDPQIVRFGLYAARSCVAVGRQQEEPLMSLAHRQTTFPTSSSEEKTLGCEENSLRCWTN